MIELTPTEQLFIRACKSENPDKKIRLVYRRRYMLRLDQKAHEDSYLVGILAQISDRVLPMSTMIFIDGLWNPIWVMEERLGSPPLSMNEKMLRILINHFRYVTPYEHFANYRTPLKHKKRLTGSI